MSYKCREVICPFCKHKFMWMNGAENIVTVEYYLKENGERLDSASCPKCHNKMIIMENVLEGVTLSDEKIRTICVRGI